MAQVLGHLKANEFPILDHEAGAGNQRSRCQQALDAMDRWAGFTSTLYSSESFLRDNLGGAAQWKRPRWIASYLNSYKAEMAHYPAGATFWQYSDRERFPGLPQPGGRQRLSELAGGPHRGREADGRGRDPDRCASATSRWPRSPTAAPRPSSRAWTAGCGIAGRTRTAPGAGRSGSCWAEARKVALARTTRNEVRWWSLQGCNATARCG